jgi:hypothetical protein
VSLAVRIFKLEAESSPAFDRKAFSNPPNSRIERFQVLEAISVPRHSDGAHGIDPNLEGISIELSPGNSGWKESLTCNKISLTEVDAALESINQTLQ